MTHIDATYSFSGEVYDQKLWIVEPVTVELATQSEGLRRAPLLTTPSGC
jgi:hypothetical protein